MKLPDDLIKKIICSLEDEETDIFLMTLYCMSSDEMDFFNGEDRGQVKRIFKKLAEDTRRHAELLKSMISVMG